VQEREINKIEVSIMNPIEAMQAVNNENLNGVTREATNKLQKVLENI